MKSRKLLLLAVGNRGIKFCLFITLVIMLAGILSPKSSRAAENEKFLITDGVLVNCTASESTVTIPDTVTTIGDWAFSDCKEIEKVIIPSSVTTIGCSAFSNCYKLKEVTIPKSVTSIKQNAFNGTRWLSDQIERNDFVIVGNGILIRYAGDNPVVEIPSEVKVIAAASFEHEDYFTVDYKRIYSKVKKVTIPKGVIEIGDRAFYGCTNLETITIPETVAHIGFYAFEGTKWLENNKSEMIIVGDGVLYEYQGKDENVMIPSSVTYIGAAAFRSCSNLETVTIPKTIKYIGSEAFAQCKQLQNVMIDKNALIDSIQSSVFSDCEMLSSINIPNAVHSIESSAFFGCTNLKNVTLPNNLKSIGNGAFYKCNSLSEISLPESLTYIGDSAFYECKNLIEIRIPDKVKFQNSVNLSGVFKGCSQLRYVNLPNELTEIPGYIFSDCTSLIEITIPNSVTSIGMFAFKGASNLEKINYDGKLSLLGGNAFKETKWLNNITDDFVIYQNFLLMYQGKDASVTIPDNVRYICDGVFSNNKGIQEIKIPDTVESIGNFTFSFCSNLKSVILPAGLVSIGDGTFSNCISLEEITIPINVNLIGEQVFSKCSNLKTITIPGNVEVVGMSAFSGCKNLESVILEEGIKHIDDYCFAGCEKIKSITFPNTLLTIGASAYNKCKALNTVNFTKNKVDYGPDIFEGTKIYKEKKKEFFIAGDGTLLKYLGNSVKVTIPDSVTAINHNAFTDMDAVYNQTFDIKTVIVPGNVKEIFSNAFSYAPIETVILEEGVTVIGDNAFRNGDVSHIKNITIPNSVKSIGVNVFDSDADLGEFAPVITCKKGSVAYKEAMRLGLKINLIGENNEAK